jgi:hypothetical protein
MLYLIRTRLMISYLFKSPGSIVLESPGAMTYEKAATFWEELPTQAGTLHTPTFPQIKGLRL